jgi:ATP-dependent exoDNAse (exonuclease V) beta subunit (contains helicase and exonuclease domains)
MSSAALIDAAARRRITADGLDELLFVEAGAGTGKTKQLVDRVVALVFERGIPMRDIAAITFTEAAATELRARIREAFERRLHGAAPDDPIATECDVALGDLDGAAIGTVHSFAQRILSEHPIEAGLPPRVEVLDEVESLLEFDARWNEHIDRMLAASELGAVVTLARVLGVRVDDPRQPSLRDVAANFSDHWDRLGTIAATPITLPSFARSDAIAAVEAVAALLPRCEALADDSLAAHVLECRGEIELARLALASGTDQAVLRVIDGKRKWCHGAKGKAASWGGAEGKAAVKETLAAADNALIAVKERAADDVLRVLAGEIARFTISAADDRRREGRLEFHDLLVLARRLLRESPEARLALHRRYRRLLVDEFQDTDPIQIELATLIAASTEAPDAEVPEHWSEIPVDDPRLFFVGDPKQSIYRFRRADIELFLAARDRFGGEPLRLTTNFRTVPPILTWVNHVFGALMSTEVPGRQPRYEPLAGHRTGRPDTHRVVTLGGPHIKEEGLRATPLRELEAASVAQAIAGILADPDAWPVEDANGWRAARPEDIAILVPTRTSLAALMDALRGAGVEFRAETGTLVYDTQEIRDLLAILRAIAHGADARALVTALRSSVLACGDDDLVTFHHAGGQWDLGAPLPDLDAAHPVVQAMGYLRELQRERWWTPPSVLLERVVRDRQVFALALGAARARDTWRRVRFLIDQARLFEASQSADLVGFVAWAELQRSDMARVHEPLLPESDDHAVRIMTIHGAKGLEFPITVLSGLTTQLGRRRPGIQIHWDGEEVALSMRKGVQTADFDRRADLEAEMDDEEKLRLLYVACTRARDHLVVSAHHIEAKPSFAQLVWEQSQAAPADCWCAALADLPPADLAPVEASRDRTKAGDAQGPDVDLERRAEWIERRRALLAKGQVARTISATEIRRAGADRPAIRATDVQPTDLVSGHDEPNTWRRGTAATSFGRAVHVVLQDVDLATGANVEELAAIVAIAEGLPDRVNEIADAARSVLGATIVRAAATGMPTGNAFREMYVAAPVGGRVIEGYIDLLVRTPDGLVVVDYKTDSVANEADVDAKIDEYRLQLAAYALAVEATTAQAVAAGVLVFARAEGVIERRIEASDLGISVVRDLMGGAAID